MTNAATMIETYPKTVNVDKILLARVIDEALSCSQTCTAWADACLSEDMVAELTECIRAPTSTAQLRAPQPSKSSAGTPLRRQHHARPAPGLHRCLQGLRRRVRRTRRNA